MGLLNLISKSTNTMSEKTKIEKYNLLTNSIKSGGYACVAKILFKID
jgi:hypothetical protein